MLGVYVQILSDFHDGRPFSEFTVRLRNKLHMENRFFQAAFRPVDCGILSKSYHICSSRGFQRSAGSVFFFMMRLGETPNL